MERILDGRPSGAPKKSPKNVIAEFITKLTATQLLKPIRTDQQTRKEHQITLLVSSADGTRVDCVRLPNQN